MKHLEVAKVLRYLQTEGYSVIKVPVPCDDTEEQELNCLLPEEVENELREKFDATAVKEDYLNAPIWGTFYCLADIMASSDEVSGLLDDMPFGVLKRWYDTNVHTMAKGLEAGITSDWTVVAGTVGDIVAENAPVTLSVYTENLKKWYGIDLKTFHKWYYRDYPEGPEYEESIEYDTDYYGDDKDEEGLRFKITFKGGAQTYCIKISRYCLDIDNKWNPVTITEDGMIKDSEGNVYTIKEALNL
jgi:hypothetical protein